MTICQELPDPLDRAGVEEGKGASKGALTDVHRLKPVHFSTPKGQRWGDPAAGAGQPASCPAQAEIRAAACVRQASASPMRLPHSTSTPSSSSVLGHGSTVVFLITLLHILLVLLPSFTLSCSGC